MTYTIMDQFVKSIDFKRLRTLSKDQNTTIQLKLEIEHSYNKTGPSWEILHFQITAESDDLTLYTLNISYGCTVMLENLEHTLINEMFFSTLPRYLYPFIRHVIAFITSESGYPTLLLTPINFDEMFQYIVSNKQYQYTMPQ